MQCFAWQGATLSYADLDKRVNQLAHRLISLGVDREVPVGVMMERSLDLIVALLGVLKAGGAYVPMDPSYPPDRLALMLEDSEVGCLYLHMSKVSMRGNTVTLIVCMRTLQVSTVVCLRDVAIT